MTLTLQADSAGTRYVKIDATNIDRIQGETGGRETIVCYKGVTWTKDGKMKYVNTNITVFEPVEDVIKKFEKTGQRMKSFQCYTNDKDIERVINGGLLRMTNLAGGVIMDTDLKDPRGKLRCLQQAEDEKRKGVKNNEIYYTNRRKPRNKKIHDKR